MTVACNAYVIFLLDESSAMASVMRETLADGSESTKTTAERVATSINGVLRQLSVGPACHVAVVGYRCDPEGRADVGCRWTESLAGREFVSSTDLVANARVETRSRRVPQADGTVLDEQVPFSVWYEPTLSGKAPQVAAFTFCRELLERHAGDVGKALLVHVFAGSSSDGNPQNAVKDLLDLAIGPVLLQCHMAASASLVTTAFPSKQAYLSAGVAQDLFTRCSELTAAMREKLLAAKFTTQIAARGLIHNAKMADLFRCLQLVAVHVAADNVADSSAILPPIVAVDTGSSHGATTVESADSGSGAGLAMVPGNFRDGQAEGMLVLVLDRSVENPCGGSIPNSCMRLQDEGNEILKQLSTKELVRVAVDTAIISYGLDSDGESDVRLTFDGPLANRTIVRNSELPAGAIRIEESEVQVSNGVGGLIKINKKTPIYFDVEPAAALPPQAAFRVAAKIVDDWRGQHQDGLPPLILHLTRGSHAAADIAEAASLLHASASPNGPTRLHHLIITEHAHKSLAYPDSDVEINEDGLRAMWQASSELLGWEKLCAAKRPYLKAASRGFVVNGRLDVIGEQFLNALAPVPG